MEPDEATLTLPVGEKPILEVEDQFGPREVQARVTKTKRVRVPASKEVIEPDLDNDIDIDNAL